MFYSVVRRVRIKSLERLFPFQISQLSDSVELVFQSDSEQAARYYYDNLVTETPEWYLITSHLVFSNEEIAKD